MGVYLKQQLLDDKIQTTRLHAFFKTTIEKIQKATLNSLIISECSVITILVNTEDFWEEKDPGFWKLTNSGRSLLENEEYFTKMVFHKKRC